MVAAIIALVALARLYLAVDTPTTVLVAIIIGVAFLRLPLAVRNEVYPVTYRRERTAHLDVGGRRGEAIRRALQDQLGVIVDDVEPFALEGSASSYLLRIKVKGEEDAAVRQAVRPESSAGCCDRWYKFGRALLALGGWRTRSRSTPCAGSCSRRTTRWR